MQLQRIYCVGVSVYMCICVCVRLHVYGCTCVHVYCLEKKRKLKEFDACKARTQRARVQDVVHYANNVKCPLSALSKHMSSLHHQPELTLSYLLTAAQRKNIRPVLPAVIPSEHTLTKLKYTAADAFGTRTASVKVDGIHYAYVTDPLKLMRHCLLYSAAKMDNEERMMIIGGDKGRGTTKLGITYINPFHCLQYLPLLVYDGEDDNEGLNMSGHVPFQFTGESQQYTDIWDILNDIAHHYPGYRHRVYLGGDWNFLNSVMGIKAPSNSHYPCMMCKIDKSTMGPNAFLQHPPFQQRTISESCVDGRDYSSHMLSMIPRNGVVDVPLLKIDTDRIIPLPLHVLLGLVNVFIECIKSLCMKSTPAPLSSFHTILHSIKTTSPSSGASSIYALNGNEVKYLLQEKYKCQQKFIDLLDTKSTEYSSDRDRIMTMFDWMKVLYDYLLPKATRTEAERAWIQKYVTDDIYGKWQHITQRPPTPKCHMLFHCVEYIVHHGSVGRFAESALESFHHTFSCRTSKHTNMGSDTQEKLRRALADCILSVALAHYRKH